MIRRHRRLLRLILLVVIPCLLAAIGGGWWLTGGRTVSSEDAYVKADIAEVSPEVSGRVTAVLVRDQTAVGKGEPLFKLDPEPFRLALEKAEAELDEARTTVETSRAQWAETRAQLAEMETRLAYLSRQEERQKALAKAGVAAETKLEQAENDAAVARDRLIVVKKRLARMLAALGGDPSLPLDAYPAVREKRALRDSATLDLARTVIKAPVSGTVVNVRLQPGDEVKRAVPLFAIVADTRPWVEANMKENKLTDVRVGQRARVVLDIYPNLTWDAEVESLSPATGAEFALLPPQNASGNWVKVVQRLPVRIRLLPHPGEPPLRAGMTATVTIEVGKGRRLADLLPKRLRSALLPERARAGLLPERARAASGP
jgi:membrane fusion protein, multidrug efflux system